MAKAIDFDQVADIYDYYVTVDYDLDFYFNEIPAGPRVLELMCGTGRVSLPFIRRGVNLTCLDYSAPMLEKLAEKLRHQGLQATLVAADVRDFDLGSEFDIILIPFHSFAEITQPDDRRRALGCINRHLRPGGTFICTFHNPAVRAELITGELTFRGSFPVADGMTLSLFSQEQCCDAGIVSGVQYFEIYTHEGQLHEKRCLPIKFSLISPAEFSAMAEKAGFVTEALYGDYRRAPFNPATSPHMIYILKKIAEASSQ